MTYTAPIDDMRFVLEALCDLDGLAALPGYDELSGELVQHILTGAGTLAAEVLAPLNRRGDREGAVLENGVVRTPAGFKDAYRTYQEGGWNALALNPEYGGMGLPNVLAMAVQEMVQAANMGFALCPILGHGAALALDRHGADRLKESYLEKLVTGEWAAAMVMTEPHAGSDVGALKSRAVPNGDHYLISGQKIFISYGEHDLTDNIIHLMLARTPEAPAGSKGLSLFLVPKFPVKPDGSLGPANDMRAVALEEKLGIHASPTAVMSYGENGGAIGYLVGEEGGGIACMFTMMNVVRVGVGIQGLAIAERAYQAALSYARERIQSPRSGQEEAGPVAIIKHPDVRRMLLTMRAQIEAMRALAYTTIAAGDFADRLEDRAAAAAWAQRLALLTPVVKAWCSDLGVEVSSIALQVHGGAGYIEETGVAQHYRDARITAIYEGTNGIQAIDLMSRKVLRDRGAAIEALIEEMRDGLDVDIGALSNGDAGRRDALARIAEAVRDGIEDLEQTVGWILTRNAQESDLLAANAVPFLHLVGTVTGGWLMFKSAVAVSRAEADGARTPAFAGAKIATADVYTANILPRARGLAEQVRGGGTSIMALDDALF